MRIVFVDDKIFDICITHREWNHRFVTLQTLYGLSSCAKLPRDYPYTEKELDATPCIVVDEDKFSVFLLQYPELVVSIINK